MDASLIAILIVVPFLLVFLYAGIHEYRRFKSQGRAKYGLVYDEETGTTHVTGIADDQDAYDPNDFDPNAYNDPGTGTETDESKA